MDHITTKHVDDKGEWERFLITHPEANFLHSWQWGDFHLALGKKICRIGLYKNETLVGLLLMILETTRRGKYLVVPAGPIIDWTDSAIVDVSVKEMKKNARILGASFVRVRPQLVNNSFSQEIFDKHGFIAAPTHLHAELTSQLDVTKTEEELLKGMRKQTRAEIRKGQTEKIVVETTTDASVIHEFYKIQCETARRQGFVPFSYEFLYEQFCVFAGTGNALLYTARHNTDILAYAFVIFYHTEAAYHYGASTEAGRKYPGAYLIQWEAIREAKRRKMQTYNFWGVAPTEEKKHRFYPISIFKRGFGGVDYEYLHARDLVIRPIPYFFNFVIEYTRKKWRRV